MDLVPEFVESDQSFLEIIRRYWKSVLLLLAFFALFTSIGFNIWFFVNQDRACFPLGAGEECVSIRQSLRALLQGSLPLECNATLLDGTSCPPESLHPLLPRLRTDIDTLKRLQIQP